MYKELPLGLKIITGVDALLAVLFGTYALANLFMSFIESKIIWVWIALLCFFTILAYVFMRVVANSIRLKKNIIKAHKIISTIFLYFAAALYAMNAMIWRDHQVQHQIIDSSIFFSFGIEITVFIVYPIWCIIYFRSKKIREILVN